MQIVIDIPEEVYKCVMDGTYCGTLYEELKTGTPLPEGAEILTKEAYSDLCTRAADVPSVEPERKTGQCNGCKYFEHDSVARVDGIPLIVAHEICKRWGDGCKTREDGYCFLYEPQESEDKE